MSGTSGRRLAAVVLALGFSASCGKSGSEAAKVPSDSAASAQPAAQAAAGTHAFRGKVEAVNAEAKTVTVLNDSIEGWMGSMSMPYHLDNADALSSIKVGDSISATVRDGVFDTLYDVKVIQP